MSETAPVTSTVRHVGHALVCPTCGSDGVRGSHHPSGAWLLTCAECEWHQLIRPGGRDDAWVPGDRHARKGLPERFVDPAPDGVSALDLRP